MTFLEYRKFASRSMSRLVARPGIFRLFMKGKFDPYVLWPLAFGLWTLNSRPVFTISPNLQWKKCHFSFVLSFLQLKNLHHIVTTKDLKTTGADGKSRADFPICTALSPSAKAIKVPKKNYIHERKPLLEQAGKAMKSSYLLRPFWDLKLWRFSLLKIMTGRQLWINARLSLITNLNFATS